MCLRQGGTFPPVEEYIKKPKAIRRERPANAISPTLPLASRSPRNRNRHCAISPPARLRNAPASGLTDGSPQADRIVETAGCVESRNCYFPQVRTFSPNDLACSMSGSRNRSPPVVRKPWRSHRSCLLSHGCDVYAVGTESLTDSITHDQITRIYGILDREKHPFGMASSRDLEQLRSSSDRIPFVAAGAHSQRTLTKAAPSHAIHVERPTTASRDTSATSRPHATHRVP